MNVIGHLKNWLRKLYCFHIFLTFMLEDIDSEEDEVMHLSNFVERFLQENVNIKYTLN